jgi:hypothetical protein
MSNIRISSLNGQLNGTTSTFGNTLQDGIGSAMQTTYLPKTGDTLQMYRYICSASSTTETGTGNVASITLPSAGVGLGSGRFGQLTIKLTILVTNGSSGIALAPKILDQYLLQTAVDGDGDIVQPPNFAKILTSSIDAYIPTVYSTSVVTGSAPGISLTDSAGIFTLTVASSTTLAPGSIFDIIAEIDIISGSA